MARKSTVMPFDPSDTPQYHQGHLEVPSLSTVIKETHFETPKEGRKDRNKRPSIAANIGKLRAKVLLADTVGLLLCSRQSRSLPLTNTHLLDTRPALPSSSLIPSHLSIPSWENHPTSQSFSTASASSETLTSSFHGLTPSCTSDFESDELSEQITHSRIVSLQGTPSTTTIERLAFEQGFSSQMGLLDPSYQIFANKDRTSAVCFKIIHKVAVVMGDPLCKIDQISELFEEFKEYCRQKRIGMAILGAGVHVAHYASQRKWTALEFGISRVLNPQTNEVIHEKAGKRILTQSRHLLNQTKGGITLDIYAPSLHGIDRKLEAQLGALYDDWRLTRNASNKPQAFITEYDPFLMPSLMTYIYSSDKNGIINGFAALRWLGGVEGYHVDPCVAAFRAPRGTTDLLLFASMAYARQLGISYLSIGYEPSESLLAASGMPNTIAFLTDHLYRHTFRKLPLSGKKVYFEKFRPDVTQDSSVYLVFPSRVPSLRQAVAVAHAANISLRRLFNWKTPTQK